VGWSPGVGSSSSRSEQETEEPPRDPAEPVAPEKREEESETGGADGGEFEPAKLVLELLAPAEAEERVIRAIVRDERGHPIFDALVVFREAGVVLYREKTDEDGEAYFLPYEFEKGPFRVDALARGFGIATAPEVKPGAVTELELKLRPVIVGEVRAPAQGVGVVKLFSEEGGTQTTKIRNDGTFVFDDVDEGYVTVQAEVPPYGSDSQSLLVEGGTEQHVRLRVRKRQRVRIFGQISFWPGTGRASINGIPLTVSSVGNFQFDRAIFGLNEVFIDAPDKALYHDRFTVKGREMEQFRFRLRPQRKVRGRVRGAKSRRPVEGAEIRVGVAFGDPRNDRLPLFPIDRVPLAQTDHEGRFEVGRLDDRLIYLISAVSMGYGQALVEVVPGRGFRTIDLPEGPFLFGKLRGIGGVPKDAIVTATRLGEPPKGLQFNVERAYDSAKGWRDQEGFYGLSGMLPGLYLVRVDASEYGSIETVIDLTDGRRERVDLRMRRGAHTEEEDAELLSRLPPIVSADPPAELPMDEVTILRIDARRPIHERPFPSVQVLFFEEDMEVAPPMRFDEAEFDLHGLPEGLYRAILTHPALNKAVVRDRITLQRGLPKTVALR
ncbi:MAG: carboxypeptidase-like regulatory domain-containing protein, partial [Planctomycetota bacterium]